MMGILVKRQENRGTHRKENTCEVAGTETEGRCDHVTTQAEVRVIWLQARTAGTIGNQEESWKDSYSHGPATALL